MKKIIFLLLIILGAACVSAVKEYPVYDRNFREDMHSFVINISQHGKEKSPGFIVIPQNGHDLLRDNGMSSLRAQYIEAIDGVGQEELFFGIPGMNDPTPAETHNYMNLLLEIAKENGKQVMVIDYCTQRSLIDQSYFKNRLKSFISYGATQRSLNNIPTYPANPFNENTEDITTLDKAKNFLYIINPEKYSRKSSFLNALKKTNYDLLVIDLFFFEEALSKKDIDQLKYKNNGGQRLVIAYMSIGEAEDYRYYWKRSWKWDPPEWLYKENPYWKGNYKVKYWDPSWQNQVIYNDDSYLNKILAAGFDGVYLDIIDAFVYYEQLLQNQ